MRFFTFHYMSFQGVTPEVLADNVVSWGTLPNSACDPERLSRDYGNYIDQASLADRLGFDGVAVNEHHMTPFGTMPNPNVMAAAITQRTERARIAVLGNALALRKTPLSSIEEYSMLDLLSGGRMEAGFVVGGGPEFYSFGQNPTEARDRFAEALTLARRAWTEPGPFRFDGRYYALDCVNPWPRPLQQPHPPVWVCGVGSPPTLEMCAREGLNYMGVNFHTATDEFQKQCEYFRDKADEYGREYDPNSIGWLAAVHVAETDEQARAEYLEHAAYSHSLAAGFIGNTKTFFPPGHMPPDKLAGWERHARSVALGETERGPDMSIVGSPETCRRLLTDRLRAFEIGNVVMGFQVGNMPHDVASRSMTLFAEEVMPAVRSEIDEFLDGKYPNRTNATAPVPVEASA